MMATSFAPRWLGAALALLLVATQARAATEAEVKVGYLANFAAFTEWPENSGASLRVCLLGGNDFADAIERIDGRRINNRTIQLQHLAEPVGLDACNVVFIGRGARAILPAVLDALDGRPVLTVGDSEGFARMGVMINMLLTSDRVVFDINRQAVRRSGLGVSARLLQLAHALY